MSASGSAPRVSGAARRRVDPARRRRIAEAALRVIEERGIEGLTHRAVAEVAGVPLGSTTYHFDNKDALLESAVELAEQRSAVMLRESLARFAACGDLAAAMAELTEELTLRQRNQLILDYELYLAVLHRPALRRQSRLWTEASNEAILAQTDRLTALALAYALDGMLIQSLVLDTILLASDVEPVFRRIIAGG